VRTDINGIRSVTAIEAPRPTASIADAGHEVLTRLNQIGIGKMMQAQVLSRLTDGSFMVKLADTAVRMNLPAGTQAGDALDLTLIATQPRLTFSMGGPAREAATSLSQTGRLIDTVLKMAQKEGTPTSLVDKVPLVPSSAATPTQLATALKDALTYSGLFYESHVQQWASGQRPLTELMREPQARHGNASLPAALPPNADGRTAAQSATGLVEGADIPEANGAHAARPDAKAPVPADNAPSLMQSIRTLFSSGAVTQTAAPAPASANPMPDDSTNTPASPTTTAMEGPPATKPVPHPVSTDAQTTPAKSASENMPTDTALQSRPETISNESARMISLQLDTLEQRRVAWQGELWPGQPMEWEVTEDTPQGKAAGDVERSWQSAVRFELPILGSVAATIHLRGNRLQVQVRAANETTALLLREHGSELASALDAAGSPLDLLTVKQDESADIPGGSSR